MLPRRARGGIPAFGVGLPFELDAPDVGLRQVLRIVEEIRHHEVVDAAVIGQHPLDQGVDGRAVGEVADVRRRPPAALLDLVAPAVPPGPGPGSDGDESDRRAN